MRNWHGNLSPFGKWHTGRSGNPFLSLMSTLLSGASQLIAHPLEYGSMFQDRAGATPVTAPGQLVGLVLDHGLTGKAPVLGPELVTNGTFDTDTDWTKGTGWTIADGVANINGAAAATDLTQPIGVVDGGFYEVSFEIVTLSANGRFFLLDPFFNTTGYTTTGTKSLLVVSNSGRPDNVTFRALSTDGLAMTATIDNISVRELPGYHATAISDAARGFFAVVPETGRRNLLLRSAEANVSPWSVDASTGSGVTLTGGLASDGVTQFAVFNEGTSTSAHRANQSVSVAVAAGTAVSISAEFKAGTSRYILLGTNRGGIAIDTDNGTVTQTIAPTNTTTTNVDIVVLGGGLYRASVTVSHTTDTTIFYVISTATSGTPGTMTPVFAGTSRTAVFTFSQAELGSTATPYQRVGTQFDVTEAGVKSLSYLAYNGVNTAYQTPVLPAPGVDKVQVFAGVRKLSDAAAAVVIESSTNHASNNGTFILLAPQSASATYRFGGVGTIQVNAGVSGFAAPITNVLSGLGDISGDRATLRVNGAQVAQSTADQGTGNYNPSGTYPLFYGARAGTSLFFNGRHYGTLGPITRFGTNATADQIEAAEAYYTARVI